MDILARGSNRDFFQFRFLGFSSESHTKDTRSAATKRELQYSGFSFKQLRSLCAHTPFHYGVSYMKSDFSEFRDLFNDMLLDIIEWLYFLENDKLSIMKLSEFSF